MRKLVRVLAAAVVLLTATTAFAYVTVDYYNQDSTDYVAKAVCHGSTYDVPFDHSRTASVTIQGDAPCDVTLNGVTLTLSGGEKLVIKDGKLARQ